MIYGAKIIAPNGSYFTLPDTNPFVFYKKITFQITGNAQGVSSIDTGIPVSTVAIICSRFREVDPLGIGLGGIQAGPNPSTGTWWVWASAYEQKTYTIDSYIFVNRELNPPDSSYGIVIYDENGIPSFHTNSKPLKLQVYSYPSSGTFSINMGYPVAAPCTVLSCRKGGGLIGDLDFTYAVCMGTYITATLGFEGYLGQPNYTGFRLDAYYYIDCRDYD